MSEAVVVALIGLGGSGIGSLIGVLASSHLMQYRIEQLEKKVDAHNNLITRTYELEKRADIVDEKIRVVNHRIKDMEANERR